jgi:hypothetical protein
MWDKIWVVAEEEEVCFYKKRCFFCGETQNEMAGVLLHSIAGTALYGVGRFYYAEYFTKKPAVTQNLLLAVICVFFSVGPDIFLGTYYITHLVSYETLLPYHIFTHFILLPEGIIVFTLLGFILDTKRKPYWIMGLCALLLHFLMDMVLEESGWLF